MTAILGISAFYHDSAAALVVDGEIVAAAQEERFTRKKHDEGFPQQAVEYWLAEAGLKSDQLDYVGFYEKSLRKFERAGRNDKWQKGKRISSAPTTVAQVGSQGTYGGGWADPGEFEDWAAGSSPDGSIRKGICTINCSNGSGDGGYSFHAGGIQMVLADGSVRFLSENVSNVIFANLGTHQGGQVLGEF